ICIVTTAGLPWRTGTAVNPLARALYLTRGRPKHHITLLIPWLENSEEQSKVYGSSNVFSSPEEQKVWIQTYARELDNLQISFYPAKYHNSFGSIFATVDICTLIPKNEADIAILEEPEHLTWFRSLPISTEEAMIGWTAKFSYVVGILHTNYSAYMKQYGLGTSIVTASALQALSSVCVKAYTHRLIRLSATLPELDASKEVTCNVHGVRSEFFVKDDDSGNGDDLFVLEQPIYFIGKVIWAKGFDKLLEIEDLYRKENGEYFPITIYGDGPDFDAISRAFLGRGGLARVFLGVKDHALLRDIPQHKIFINLSITEVLCTTTAEALAMGKFVIIPNHPSNTFFLQFPNCLAYETKSECVEKIKFALENDPVPLSAEDKYKLTWEGANLRLYEASAMTEAEA
ncbi:hypothetical protein FRACYDRAFT_138536, partial [Fragilariopsis cylindrus CCMP1102]